jgi:carbonic anhydrase
MFSIQKLLEQNQAWAARKIAREPDFFSKSKDIQTPKFLWIGCSDSRVPASEITDTDAGEIFEHRNIANVVDHTDLNVLSVIQYGVEVLKIKHIIVCGHYGCGGIKTALSAKSNGLIDNWLRNIKDIYRLHHGELDHLEPKLKFKKLVELNVIENAFNVCKTSIVQQAWQNNQALFVHGWVYDLETGYIKDLNITTSDNQKLHQVYQFDKDLPDTLQAVENLDNLDS